MLWFHYGVLFVLHALFIFMLHVGEGILVRRCYLGVFLLLLVV